jgi:hypothetical protein
MLRARPSVSSFSLRTVRKYSSFSSRAIPRGGRGSGGSWKGSPEARGCAGGTWATGTSPPLPAGAWGGCAGAAAGLFPEDLRGKGGGAAGPGGPACWGGGGARRAGGGGGRSLRGEGFIAEVQILKRIDVFRCAGHRLNGQTTCPPGVYPKAAVLRGSIPHAHPPPTRQRPHRPPRAPGGRARRGLADLGQRGRRRRGPDEAGLAHLHEHMLFKGTERRGPGEIARDIEAHGGEVNAWTSFDHTVYHTVMASQFAARGARRARRCGALSPLRRRRARRECEVGGRGDQARRRHAGPPLLTRPVPRRATRCTPTGFRCLEPRRACRATTRDRILGSTGGTTRPRR